MYIDTHAHVHDSRFDLDRAEVFKRAFENEVGKIILIGTDIGESKKALVLANQYESAWASVAVHPHEYSALEGRDDSLSLLRQWSEELEQLASGQKVVAMGECGLDYFRRDEKELSQEQKLLQMTGLKEHLKLAQKHSLPVIIHTRTSSPTSDDAYEDVLHMLQKYASKENAIILHCYLGSVTVTKKFLELSNVFFSFAPNITFPVKKEIEGKPYDIRKAIQTLPLERILSETDCPYLAPQSHRGERNEPRFVRSVVEKIAQVKNVEEVDVEQMIEHNTKTAFGI